MEKIGYRNNYWGTGTTNLKEIYLFEIFELGNTDIIDYALEHYTDGMHKEDVDLLMKISEEPGIVFDIEDENKAMLINELIDSVYRATGQQIKYGLWLASLDVVNELYDGLDGDVQAYETSEVILSDLGFNDQGVLFGYTDNPYRTKQIK